MTPPGPPSGAAAVRAHPSKPPGKTAAPAPACVASAAEGAREAAGGLDNRTGGSAPERADVTAALGGAGSLLKPSHPARRRPPPIFGMNRGSIGFRPKNSREDDLRARLDKAM